MEFSPFNTVVKLCLQGIQQRDAGNGEESIKLFQQSWNEASNHFEKFIAAYFVASLCESPTQKLHWSETSLHSALNVNDAGVQSALPTLYQCVANCHEELGELEKSRGNLDLAKQLMDAPSQDEGPFYHGTKAALSPGELLKAGGKSNYKEGLTMNHIYFTGMASGAKLAAAMAKGAGAERVYIVEPTGSFEDDPNVTDKKFPGNLTRSYRSQAPLRIIAELTDPKGHNPEEVAEWKRKLETNSGEIIN